MQKMRKIWQWEVWELALRTDGHTDGQTDYGDELCHQNNLETGLKSEWMNEFDDWNQQYQLEIIAVYHVKKKIKAYVLKSRK